MAKNKKTYAEKAAKKVSHLPKILAICGVVVLAAVAAAWAFLHFSTDLGHDRILSNVTIAGVDVSNMTKEEAVSALNEAIASTYTQQDMTIHVHKDTHVITPAMSAAQLDVEAAVEDAYNFGRQGFYFQMMSEQKQAEAVGYHIGAGKHLKLDLDSIRSQIDSISQLYNQQVTDSKYQLDGSKPDLEGDITDAKTQVLTLTIGTPGYELNAQQLYDMVIEAYRQNEFTVFAECQVVEPAMPNIDSIQKETCIEAVDAIMDTKTFEVSEHKYGYTFDVEKAKSDVASAAYGQVLSYPYSIIEPAVLKESLEALLFRDVLSSYTAYSSSSYNRDINLKLSCQAINGVVLLPGEVFSYNPTLGERTPEAGYKQADGYMGMETTLQYGGGICQASSSLYYCAMVADMEIVERVNHGFVSSYMPLGMDATVSWGGPEFLFKNTSEYPIRIEAYASGGTVTVKLIGTDTKDYYVKMQYEVLSVTNYKTVEQEMEADNPKGYKDGDTITSPYTGYKIRTYRCKYDKATDQLISREVEVVSNYSARDHVICKIKQPETTEPSTPDVPTDPSIPSEPGVQPDETTPPESSESTESTESTESNLVP